MKQIQEDFIKKQQSFALKNLSGASIPAEEVKDEKIDQNSCNYCLEVLDNDKAYGVPIYFTFTNNIHYTAYSELNKNQNLQTDLFLSFKTCGHSFHKECHEKMYESSNDKIEKEEYFDWNVLDYCCTVCKGLANNFLITSDQSKVSFSASSRIMEAKGSSQGSIEQGSRMMLYQEDANRHSSARDACNLDDSFSCMEESIEDNLASDDSTNHSSDHAKESPKLESPVRVQAIHNLNQQISRKGSIEDRLLNVELKHSSQNILESCNSNANKVVNLSVEQIRRRLNLRHGFFEKIIKTFSFYHLGKRKDFCPEVVGVTQNEFEQLRHIMKNSFFYLGASSEYINSEKELNQRFRMFYYMLENYFKVGRHGMTTVDVDDNLPFSELCGFVQNGRVKLH